MIVPLVSVDEQEKISNLVKDSLGKKREGKSLTGLVINTIEDFLNKSSEAVQDDL